MKAYWHMLAEPNITATKGEWSLYIKKSSKKGIPNTKEVLQI